VLVRARSEEDLDQCVRVAEAVRQLDGYPVFLDSDFRTFLVAPDALAAWVVEDAGRVIGHVALHQRTIPEALAIAGHALGRPVDQLGVVARLLVAPSARQRGVGRLLLDTATREARARSRWPILDVCADFGPAVALYEAQGWVRAGSVPLHLDGRYIEELVYLAPPPDPDG
jgi:GNAT superfamily N-acetyltransferase